MAEPPTSFTQQEILAPVELTKGMLTYVAKKIQRCCTRGAPADLKKALASDPQALATWEDITPLARNEWICWIEAARKPETRSRRIAWGCSSLKDGKGRPCCWPGCAQDGQTGLATADWNRPNSDLRVIRPERSIMTRTPSHITYPTGSCSAARAAADKNWTASTKGASNWERIHSSSMPSLAQNTRNIRTKPMTPRTWESAIAVPRNPVRMPV
jgi:Bacteriocin-protection, YdeI or OmpD-Associated